MDKPPVAASQTDNDEATSKTSENSQISCLCEPLPNGQFGRNLVVSIDGTANQFGLKNTNIVELYSRLVKDETQLTYYNSGIGTYVADSTSWSSFTQYISHQWDKAFATNFKSKVLDAYEWLSENYRQGDRIFLFGFSRGAYQVRVIAGMIEKVGLLHKGNTQQIPFAYDLYTATLTRGNRNTHEQESSAASVSKHGSETPEQTTAKISSARATNKSDNLKTPGPFRRSSGAFTSNNAHHSDSNVVEILNIHTTVNSAKKAKGTTKETPEDLCRQFKKSLSNSDVKVHFVGSWDTVSSVGILRRQCLPETTSGMTHVCAFRHALALDERRVKFLPEYANGGAGSPSKGDVRPAGKESRSSNLSSAQLDEKSSIFSTPLHLGPVKPVKKRGGNVKEVWFPGSHSDVGGGNVNNLENDQFGPSLRWMTYEALIWGLRMMPFNQTWAPLTPKSSMSWTWSVLENLPISRLSYSSPDGTTRVPHRKKPRKILDGQLVHESVFQLMAPNPQQKSTKKPYRPTARLPKGMNWDSNGLQSGEKSIVEADPYIQPDRLLDAIKTSVQNKESFPDYEKLFKLSLTPIGLRSIRERPGAEDILVSALESESRNQWPGRMNHISIIARILDRCFDLIPVDFRDNPIPSADSSIWKILNERYSEASPARTKFLYRFADRNTRTALVKDEIESHRLALQCHPLPPERIRIDVIRDLIVALVNSLIMTTSLDAELSHRKLLRGIYKEALRFFELSHARRFALIKSLAIELDKHFELGHEGYFDERIALFKTVFELAPPESIGREDYLLHLLPLLYQQFQETSDKEDIDQIIPYNAEILSLLSSNPYPAVGTLAAILALSYLAQSQLKGRLYHIEEAIMLLQESILNSPLTNRDRVPLFDILGYSLHLRFKETGQSSYLEQADRAYNRAIDAHRSFDPDEDHPVSGLAAVLCDTFKLSRKREYLDRAISLHRESFPLFSSLPRQRQLPASLFADALLCRFEESSQQADLDEAISLYEDALELNPRPHFARARCLNSLGVALRKHFEKNGQKLELDKAVSMHREALELCPHPYLERDKFLSGLATALAALFTVSDEQCHLQEAIILYRQALQLLPPTHPRMGDSLFGLANVLQKLFEATSQQDKPVEAISLRKAELELHPSGRPNSLSGLVAAVLNFYTNPPPEPEEIDDEVDEKTVPDRYAGLDEAISLLKESLKLRPFPNPARVESLNSLVNALVTRYGNGHYELHLYREELVYLQSPRPTTDTILAHSNISKAL